MDITGDILIGSKGVAGGERSFRAINPATGEKLEPFFAFARGEEVGRACELAWSAFQIYRETGLEERAGFLETIAANISEIGPTLIERASAETGLPPARIEGERARTVGQLKLFADVVRAGEWLDLRIDSGDCLTASRCRVRICGLAQHRARTRCSFRCKQLPARFFGRGRRYRIGARGRLPGRCEGRIQLIRGQANSSDGRFKRPRSPHAAYLKACSRFSLGEIETGGAACRRTRASRRLGFTGSRGGGHGAGCVSRLRGPSRFRFTPK